MNILELQRDTDRRIQRILTAGHPAAIESRANAFQYWASREDRYGVIATHLSRSIWTVASVLRDDRSVLVDMQEAIPSSGRIVLDVLLDVLATGDEDRFVSELVSAFAEHWDSDDLVFGLTLLVLGMATRLGGWIWVV